MQQSAGELLFARVCVRLRHKQCQRIKAINQNSQKLTIISENKIIFRRSMHNVLFPECVAFRSEGFLFLSGGLGGGVFDSFLAVCADVRGVVDGVSIGRWISECLPARAAWWFAWQAWGIVEDLCPKSMVDVHFAWQACRFSHRATKASSFSCPTPATRITVQLLLKRRHASGVPVCVRVDVP